MPIGSRVLLAQTPVTRAGVNAGTGGEATLDATNGNYFVNDGNVILQVRNSSAGALNVVIEVPGNVDGQANTDRTVSVDATTTLMIGPFPTSIYNQSEDGQPSAVYLSCAGGGTNLKAIAWKL